MNLETKCHGVREYSDDDVIIFNKGIPGFENLHKFILFSVEENEVFDVLHSVDNNEVGIIVMSPFTVEKDYELKLSEEVIERLKINSPEDVLVLTTVTLNSSVKHITTNLRAPIIINIKEKIGEQIILNTEKYLIKHPVFKEEN